jgi:hypothetical protein
MEKIPSNDHFKYPITRFVREDIIELMKIFLENCQKTVLVIEGYKLNSIEELKELPLKEAVNFKFQGYDPYISVESLRFQSRIYLSDTDNVTQQGMKAKIDEIFKRNKSILSYFESAFLNIIVMLGIGILLGQLSKYNLTATVILTIVIASCWFYSYYTSMKRHTVVYLTKSKVDLTLWEKHGEGAIVTFIITVVAGIFVYLLSKII